MSSPPPFVDYYAVLGVSVDATGSDIKRAYRRLALELHPDKNPDDAAAVDRFHRLAVAKDVLVDAEARAAFDAVRVARNAVAERRQRMSAHRKALTRDLEAREAEAAVRSRQGAAAAAQAELARHLARLRERGMALRRQTTRDLRKRSRALDGDGAGSHVSEVEARMAKEPTIGVRWSKRGRQYTGDELRTLFAQDGEVDVLWLKRNRAFIIFTAVAAGWKALRRDQTGEPRMRVNWIGTPPDYDTTAPADATTPLKRCRVAPVDPSAEGSEPSVLQASQSSQFGSLQAFEDDVLARMMSAGGQ